MASNKTMSIAVVSGKGGVGKSNLALNLASAISGSGAKVLLMDCDLGLANLDVLLGITPEYNLQSLSGDNVDLKSALVNVDDGFDLLPAASGISGSVEQEKRVSPVLVQKLNDLSSDYDFIIMDIGAGIGAVGMSFAAMAQIRLLIITPEPTSLTDGYALVKVMSARYGVRDHFVIINQVENKKEEDQTFKRLTAATSHFLDITPTAIGGVRADKKLQDAVRQQKIMFKLFPHSPAAQDFQTIASKLQSLRATMLPRIGELSPLRILNAIQPTETTK